MLESRDVVVVMKGFGGCGKNLADDVGNIQAL
jgi:hypothetical protein